MTPEHYFRIVGDLATGRASAEATAHALYQDASAEDVRRLGIHVRYLRWYRASVLETHFPECRRAVISLVGDEAWKALAEDFFQAHPPSRVPMHRNAGPFVAFLQSRSASSDLPLWLVEIADLEWMEWLVTSAVDDPEDAHDDGPLRVTPTLQKQVYRHDLLQWLDEEPEGAVKRQAPRALSSLIVVWRDRNLIAQRAGLGALELAVLDDVRAGRDPRRDPNATAKSDASEVAAAVSDLFDFGVLRGGSMSDPSFQRRSSTASGDA